MLNSEYKIEKLANGITLLMEEIPTLRSVAVGILTGVGSKNEPDDISGISHYIEHMLFKRTAKRSARDIAEQIDAIGGRLNAHTSKEYTSYYAVVLDTHIDIAVDILSDMYLNSIFDKDELVTERNVILEEINMYEDTPDENIHDLAMQNIWDKHPLGKPIIGQAASINKITREKIINYYKEHYTPENTIISVAGNIKATEISKLIRDKFEHLAGKKNKFTDELPHINPGMTVYKKKTEQVHVCIGTKGVSYESDDRFALSLMSAILGGNMSSRLFQKVREQKGLVYSIYTYPAFYQKSGLFMAYAGTNLKNSQQVVDLMLQEFKEIKEKGITQEELTRAREQLKGSMVLSMETSSSRMSWLAKAYYYYCKIDSLETVFKKVDNVKAEDIQRMANSFFIKENMHLTAIGDFPKKNYFKELIC